MESPLCTITGGAIRGTIYGFCAGFVSSLLPDEVKPVVPILVGTAAVYQNVGRMRHYYRMKHSSAYKQAHLAKKKAEKINTEELSLRFFGTEISC